MADLPRRKVVVFAAELLLADRHGLKVDTEKEANGGKRAGCQRRAAAVGDLQPITALQTRLTLRL